MAGMKQGAVVVLRSGSPEMTIKRIGTSRVWGWRYACCYWFEKTRPRSGDFALHLLDVVAQGKPVDNPHTP